MKRENNNPRFVYPMAMVDKMFSAEEIDKMSERREFNREDALFHFSEEEGWIESINEEDFQFYNKSVPTNKVLLKMAM